MYRTIHFKHDRAGDWQTAADGGDEVAPESRELPDAVAQIVAQSVSSVSAVEQHEYYGWAFDAKVNDCSFYTVFNIVPEECWITAQLRWYWLKSLLGKKPKETFDQYCGIVEDALRKTQGVSEMAWQEYRK